MTTLHHILNPIILQEQARIWIKEDLPHFDLQGFVCGDAPVVSKIFCKSPGVLAGVPFVNAVLQELQCTPNWFCMEGEWLDTSKGPIEVAYVGGSAVNVLVAERVVLNILSRCSGVATKSRRVRRKLNDLGWEGFIAGSRKTTPGFRMVEKYGLLVGGAATHRYDLSHMIMLKDNHVTICGSMAKAIQKVKAVAGFSSKIEVESRTLEEALEAAKEGVDIIMLDNFQPQVRGKRFDWVFSNRDLQDIAEASKYLKLKYPHILIEASGGITEENAFRYAKLTVDIISMSSLVQGYEAVDFSMKVLPKKEIKSQS